MKFPPKPNLDRLVRWLEDILACGTTGTEHGNKSPSVLEADSETGIFL
jgi:hypothetical protein